MAVKKAAKAAEPIEYKFSKDQLLHSKAFAGRTDIVNALLSPGKLYTVKAVEEMIEKYMKGKVI